MKKQKRAWIRRGSDEERKAVALEAIKRWRKKNPSKVKRANEKWAKKNPERVRELSKKSNETAKKALLFYRTFSGLVDLSGFEAMKKEFAEIKKENEEIKKDLESLCADVAAIEKWKKEICWGKV